MWVDEGCPWMSVDLGGGQTSHISLKAFVT